MPRGRFTDQTGTFILDEAWGTIYGHTCYANAESRLEELIDPADVLRDGESSATYLGSGYGDVIGYASFGMHDPGILTGTQWARPHFVWKPGAAAVIMESGGGKTVRYAQHAYRFKDQEPIQDPDNPAVAFLTGECVLRVHVDYTENITKHFTGYRLSIVDTATPEIGWNEFSLAGILVLRSV
ncbi:MAG: hypothetical protein A2Z18_06540 [Armatimonadetes bacterium RBG_16_58_9]|nr:MAG: hypothetical protein A2Z18_06540 [Armatimonadetes bacterium RBG_16_58_9]